MLAQPVSKTTGIYLVKYQDLTNLHLDVQNHDLPAGGQVRNGHLARAVAVPAEFGMLYELAFVDQLLELVHLDVVVVDAGLLAGPRVARRVRDGRREDIGPSVQEQLVQRALADAAGPADHNRPVVAGNCVAGCQYEFGGRGSLWGTVVQETVVWDSLYAAYLLPLCARDTMSGREKLVGGVADMSAVGGDTCMPSKMKLLGVESFVGRIWLGCYKLPPYN